MATPAQTRANRTNSEKSSGPTTQTGKATSSQNRTTHGLAHHNGRFYLLEDEDGDKFETLRDSLYAEHQPQTVTECILVRRMAEHEWLRTRALRLQRTCIFEDRHVIATDQFSLYMRYQTTQERAFYKALTEFQKLRNERTKQEIGFEAQERRQAAEQRAAAAEIRAAELHEMKKQDFERKNRQATPAPQPENTQNQPGQPAAPNLKTGAGDHKMAA